MTFDELLPAFIVLGYLLAFGVGRLGVTVRRRARGFVPGPDTAGSAPEVASGHGRQRAGTVLVVVGWLLGIAVTLTWAIVAIGWSAFLGVLLVIVVVPAARTFLFSLAGRLRRQRADGRISIVWPWLLLGGLGLGLVVAGGTATINAVAHHLSDDPVALRVTASTESGGPHNNRHLATVAGTYSQDGQQHAVEAIWLEGPVPDEGDVVEVTIAPIWPHPLLAGPLDAGALLGGGVAGGAAGGLLLWMAARERRDHSEHSTLAGRDGGAGSPQPPRAPQHHVSKENHS
ncbi:hypothetical protein [Saccharomonospora piscinae]|uniref:hypothetical protein n=1 Tax=Saccharomonospora piscinae TaxID=687388 RepID=UPI000464F85F|nr:hypothetical protein [Saccharomonospora piscinae]